MSVPSDFLCPRSFSASSTSGPPKYLSKDCAFGRIFRSIYPAFVDIHPKPQSTEHYILGMEEASAKKAQIVRAPARPELVGKRSVFLGGTTTRTPGRPDWRKTLTDALAHLPVTVLNPFRSDWDSSWIEDVTFTPFQEQVEWELDMQERADVVVVYYGPTTDAPVSLLELGLCARSGKAIVACHRDYNKRGHVEIVSRRMGIEVLDADDFIPSVVRRLESLLEG